MLIPHSARNPICMYVRVRSQLKAKDTTSIPAKTGSEVAPANFVLMLENSTKISKFYLFWIKIWIPIYIFWNSFNAVWITFDKSELHMTLSEIHLIILIFNWYFLKYNWLIWITFDTFWISIDNSELQMMLSEIQLEKV